MLMTGVNYLSDLVSISTVNGGADDQACSPTGIFPLSMQSVTKTSAHPNLTNSFRQAIISYLSSSSFYERALWSTGLSTWKSAYPRYLGIEESGFATRPSQGI